jgi:excisionase family DNA binding protein
VSTQALSNTSIESPFTVDEVCKIGKMSRPTVLDLIRRKKLRAIRVGRNGRHYRIPASAVREFFEGQAAS